MLALLGGHIDAVTVSTAEVASHVSAGKLRALAVMADKRVIDGFETVPTLKELQIDLSMGIWRGLSAPKNTPDEVIAVLVSVAAKASREPVMREALQKLHFSTDTYGDSATLSAQITRESAFFKELIERLNIGK